MENTDEYRDSNEFNEIKLYDFLHSFDELNKLLEVQTELVELTDGTEVIVVGEPAAFKEFNHQQGDNKLEFKSTCGLVSCENILHQFGIHVTENTLVQIAEKCRLCHINPNNSFESGGTTVFDQKELLKLFDVPAHVELLNEFESLATFVEQGKGVIIEVNAGILWDDIQAYDTGAANHAVTITGVARNPENGRIEGFFINDSGRGYEADSGRFVNSALLDEGWLESGGACVVTDIIRLNNN